MNIIKKEKKTDRKKAKYTGLPTSGPYKVCETFAILADETRKDPFEKDGSARETPVHFFFPKTEGEERFPLVIFSHGAFGFYKSNYSTYTELASCGYVVAALDHPHHAFKTKDSAGKTVRVDGSFMKSVRIQGASRDPETLYPIYTEWMDLRVKDMNSAADTIKAAAQSGEAGERWFVPEGNEEDILCALRACRGDKLGLIGHSLGGAAAVELGRERDDVSAVVDLDGTMLGEYSGIDDGKFTVREEPYPVPVLDFVNWDHYSVNLPAYREEGGVYPNDVLIRSAKEGFSTTVRGTKHMDFTDLPMFSPFLGRMLGSGECDKAQTMNTVNRLVRSFFDRYLKNKGEFEVSEEY